MVRYRGPDVSGIVAIVRTDGVAISPDLVQTLTASLASRGPDARASRCDGPAALGHTLLHTGPISDHDCQPLTLDGRSWIVADGRIDARSEVIAMLERDTRQLLPAASDAELILRAYMKWGTACVERLLGDFAFAIWDASTRRLFCARDHLGVKPLYYAQIGAWLVVSNAIECLRHHPDVSDELDDLAVADFLLFGHKTDHAATTFRDIRRLPPAHTLIWSRETGASVRRYWELPIDEPIYVRDADYVDELVDVMNQAVADRLRTDRVGIFFSGGIDSTALAATAVRQINSSAIDPVRAFSFVYDSVIEDDERTYATAAARHLAIPCQYYIVDRFAGWPDSSVVNTPEPLLTPGEATARDCCHADMAAHSRIAFLGEGPDNAMLYEWRPYLAYLTRTGRWGRMAVDAMKFLGHHRRPPLLSTIFRRRTGIDDVTASLPPWVAPALAQRFRLADRMREVMRVGDSHHPVRPIAYFSLQMPLWHTIFDSLDPSYTGMPLEVRHPYLDIRVLRFLLRLPVVPWCRGKYLLRYAFRDVLPATVLRRPKTPLSGHPTHEQVRRHGLPPVRITPRLELYGVPARLADNAMTPSGAEAALRLVTFSHWLSHLESQNRPATALG
jgi:asparagine synthase (glutamine-hydrolysing)